MSTVIKVENLSKKYLLTHQPRERYLTLRDTLANGVRSFGRRLFPGAEPAGAETTREEFWALRDVSFEVGQGDRIGIIGRNGAGKSTLLKILSRITEPTRGRVSIRGRVASLLEVGTGFHPELTGRENIFLNGAILGMSRGEIRRKFDEIVDFAEVEKFLDTPVKRYSSGMYVRLAFAVAAHLDPEILVVDEVLAVGDAKFQRKCLGKMQEVGQKGQTVLFVSHNLGAVSQLCNRALLLEQGELVAQGNTTEIIACYLADQESGRASAHFDDFSKRRGTGELRFLNASLENSEGTTCQNFSMGERLIISFEILNKKIVRDAKLAVQIRTVEGLQICNMVDSDSGFEFFGVGECEKIRIVLDDLRLYPGGYFVSLWAGSLSSSDTFDLVQDCLMFNILDGGRLTMRKLPREAGVIFLTPRWVRSNGWFK